MDETLHFAGQYIVDAVEILQPGGLGIDIREVVQQITIYEDLFSPFMSGNILCYDSNDLPSLFKNAGVDILRLSMRTPTLDKKYAIERYFHVYKLSDKQQETDRSQTYMYHFISVENIADTSKQICKTNIGHGETIVESILKKDLLTDRPINVSKTMNTLKYTSNMWSPSKNLSYISDYSIAKDKTPSFLFYENRFGFNFKPLTDLIAQEEFTEFVKTDHSAGVDKKGKVTRDFDQDYKQIHDYTSRVTYDYMDAKAGGALHTRLLSYDFITKRFNDTTYTLNDDTHKRMNPNNFYTKKVIDSSYNGERGSVIMMSPSFHLLYNNTSSDSDTIQRRTAILKSFIHKLEITVFGRLDYTVGLVVDVSINKLKSIDKDTNVEDIPDPLLSGKYLISAICHRFTRDGKHEATIELIRDSIT